MIVVLFIGCSHHSCTVIKTAAHTPKIRLTCASPQVMRQGDEINIYQSPLLYSSFSFNSPLVFITTHESLGRAASLVYCFLMNGTHFCLSLPLSLSLIIDWLGEIDDNTILKSRRSASISHMVNVRYGIRLVSLQTKNTQLHYLSNYFFFFYDGHSTCLISEW